MAGVAADWGPFVGVRVESLQPRHGLQNAYRLAESHHVEPSLGTTKPKTHRFELSLGALKPHMVTLYERARTQIVLEHRVAPGGRHVECSLGQVRLMAMTEVFVLNRPDKTEVFRVYEDLVAGCEVDLVFVEGYAAQSPGTASSFPAYRWFVVAYDLLDRLGVQVYHVDTSVVLALMGGAHYGTGDYFREPFHAILCSVFVRQRIIHTRPERRAVLRRRKPQQPHLRRSRSAGRTSAARRARRSGRPGRIPSPPAAPGRSNAGSGETRLCERDCLRPAPTDRPPDTTSWDQPHSPTPPTATPKPPSPPARAQPKTPPASPRSAPSCTSVPPRRAPPRPLPSLPHPPPPQGTWPPAPPPAAGPRRSPLP